MTINAHSHCDAADTQMVCAQPGAEFMPAQPVKASVPRSGGSATNITASASQGLREAAPAADSADGGVAGAAGSKRCRRFIPFSDGVRTLLKGKTVFRVRVGMELSVPAHTALRQAQVGARAAAAPSLPYRSPLGYTDLHATMSKRFSDSARTPIARLRRCRDHISSLELMAVTLDTASLTHARHGPTQMMPIVSNLMATVSSEAVSCVVNCDSRSDGHCIAHACG